MRKTIIALAALAALATAFVPTGASAMRGGGGHGGGFHGGRFAAFHGRNLGSHFAFRHRAAFRNRFAFRHRVAFRNRFAFVGYGDDCFVVRQVLDPLGLAVAPVLGLRLSNPRQVVVS